MMNKIKWLILLGALWLAGILAGCDTINSTEDKITIVCTNFPLYDWTRNLLGEDSEAEVILLLNNGADMHSFQPSATEMIQIADCDILVHVGGESDAWLEEALISTPNETRVVVNLMEALEKELQAEHYAENMHVGHEHEEGSMCETEHDHSSADEHVWLSLRLAVKACEAIEEALRRVLPDEDDIIRTNGDAYCGELAGLDRKYADMVKNSLLGSVVIVADRFPFMYMMEDYGIEYYAAFPGCSTESEADFETVVFLAEEVKEHNTEVLLITEGGTDTLANTVFENAGMQGETAVLHSMQVVYQSDMDAGCSYIGYMEENLKVLERVLVGVE